MINRIIDDKQFGDIVRQLACAEGAFRGIAMHFESGGDTYNDCHKIANGISIFIDSITEKRFLDEE